MSFIVFNDYNCINNSKVEFLFFGLTILFNLKDNDLVECTKYL